MLLTDISIVFLVVMATVAMVGWLVAAARLQTTRQALAYWQDATEKANAHRRDAGERAWLAEQQASKWKHLYEERTADYDKATLRLERISLIAQDLPEEAE